MISFSGPITRSRVWPVLTPDFRFETVQAIRPIHLHLGLPLAGTASTDSVAAVSEAGAREVDLGTGTR